jgi:hypothetical protein
MQAAWRSGTESGYSSATLVLRSSQLNSWPLGAAWYARGAPSEISRIRTFSRSHCLRPLERACVMSAMERPTLGGIAVTRARRQWRR